MVEPKLGKFVWRIRNEDDGTNPVFVGIQKWRVVNWDNDLIVADSGLGDGPSGLKFHSWSNWYEDEQIASNVAHQLASGLRSSGKSVRLSDDLLPSTAVSPMKTSGA